MKSWFFVCAAICALLGVTAYAASGIVINAVLPNTSDDANLEYVEIADITCFDVDLSGYSLRDASGKTYLLSGTIGSGQKKRIMRIDSKIILNNTDERVEILSSTGAIIDQFSYVTSTKDVMLSTGHYVLPVCEVPPVITATGSEAPTGSGALESEVPEISDTPEASTGSLDPVPPDPEPASGSSTGSQA